MNDGMTYAAAAYGLTALTLGGYAFRLIRRRIAYRARLARATRTREGRGDSRARTVDPLQLLREVTRV